MTTPSTDVKVHEARIFSSKEEAIAFLQSLPEPDSIVILTPPPH